MSKKRTIVDEKDDVNLKGYISDVSPIKLARNEKTRYFTAAMQTSKTEKHKVLCFSPEKHEMFKSAEKSDEAYRIINSKVEPNQDGSYLIKTFKEGSLSATRNKLSFHKLYSSYMEPAKPETKQLKLNKLTEEYMMVDVHVKLLKIDQEPINILTQYGKRSVHHATVCDDTMAKNLTIWSSSLLQKMKQGEFFKLTCIRTKEYQNKVVLNTTSHTEVFSITPFGVCEDHSLDEQTTELISLRSAQVIRSTKCSTCSKPIDDIDSQHQLVRCQNCNYKQKRSDLQSSITVFGHCSKSDVKVIIKEPIVEFFKCSNKQALLGDADAIEDYLLLNGPYKITKQGDSIVKFEKTQ